MKIRSKRREYALDTPLEERLKLLGEELQKAAVNGTVIVVPVNMGMARSLLNLRCSLHRLHMHNVLYYTYDTSIYSYLIEELQEPYVLFNETGFNSAELALYAQGHYHKFIRQRLHIWRWLVQDLSLNFWYLPSFLHSFLPSFLPLPLALSAALSLTPNLSFTCVALRFVDADVVVLKDFRHFESANYFIHPNSKFNTMYR